jgi:hypothetical protein
MLVWRTSLYDVKMAVYRWRVSRELKAELHRVARTRDVSVSTLLNRIMRDWLAMNSFT